MTEFIQVMTTLESKEDAQRLARTLVERKVAACVQIVGPLTSIYQWQGKVEEAGEYLCIAKSRQDLFDELRQIIAANHPYEVPEILALPISAGSDSYLAWLNQELIMKTPEKS
ncbi:MAG: cytochrome C biogenesis protein CcdA [Deltaproteobacteria bacterium RIFOXYD12_FULL_57_12]|nr:MAG: cytochrome C biogenesis protein CcdA [Deltaproteobacteria bacterium RIFOXYD12_FULL_57_12]